MSTVTEKINKLNHVDNYTKRNWSKHSKWKSKICRLYIKSKTQLYAVYKAKLTKYFKRKDRLKVQRKKKTYFYKSRKARVTISISHKADIRTKNNVPEIKRYVSQWWKGSISKKKKTILHVYIPLKTELPISWSKTDRTKEIGKSTITAGFPHYSLVNWYVR